VALLDKVGGRRPGRIARGLVHHGVELAFGGARHRIDMHAATGKTVMVYGQTEVTLDLMNGAQGGRSHHRLFLPATSNRMISTPTARRVHLRQGRRCPRDRLRIHRRLRRIFTAVSRASIKPSAIRTFERVYPFGWLGILSETPPVSHELIYNNHARGFCALHHALDPPQPLLRAMPRSTITSTNGRTIGFWDETETTAGPEGGRRTRHRPLDRKRGIAPLRSFVAEPMRFRADVSGRRCRPYRAADRRQGTEILPPATCTISRARFREFYDEKSAAGIDGYSQEKRWRGVWKAVRVLVVDDLDAAQISRRGRVRRARIQLAELDYLVSSKAASASLVGELCGIGRF